MVAEYKRLEAEAREVEHQIQKLIKSPVTRTPDHIPAEQHLAELHIKLGSLRLGMMLIRSVNSTVMQKHVRRFMEALSHRFYLLYPALALLGISKWFTPKVRTHMAKTAVLPGAFAEAAEILAEQGFTVSVNRLRNVTAGLGVMPARLTVAGAVKPSTDVIGRRDLNLESCVASADVTGAEDRTGSAID